MHPIRKTIGLILMASCITGLLLNLPLSQGRAKSIAKEDVLPQRSFKQNENDLVEKKPVDSSPLGILDETTREQEEKADRLEELELLKEMEEQITVGKAASRLDAYLNNYGLSLAGKSESQGYPDDYAGHYIDGDRLVLLLTRQGNAEPYLKDFSTTDPVDVKFVEYSYNDLQALAEDIYALFGENLSGYSVDVLSNSVRIDVQRASEGAAVLLSLNEARGMALPVTISASEASTLSW